MHEKREKTWNGEEKVNNEETGSREEAFLGFAGGIAGYGSAFVVDLRRFCGHRKVGRFIRRTGWGRCLSAGQFQFLRAVVCHQRGLLSSGCLFLVIFNGWLFPQGLVGGYDRKTSMLLLEFATVRLWENRRPN